jgi:hypothetical protein
VKVESLRTTNRWPFNSTSSFAGTKIWRAAPEICGAIFDAARPADELARIEQRVGEPDFWKDQAGAQKLLQRRRRLEDDLDLSKSLQQRMDDLAVLVEWANAGEDVAADLARALDELEWGRWLTYDSRGCTFTARLLRKVVAEEMMTSGQRRRFLAALAQPDSPVA